MFNMLCSTIQQGDDCEQINLRHEVWQWSQWENVGG